jgi:hypothetical protein
MKTLREQTTQLIFQDPSPNVGRSVCVGYQPDTVRISSQKGCHLNLPRRCGIPLIHQSLRFQMLNLPSTERSSQWVILPRPPPLES